MQHEIKPYARQLRDRLGVDATILGTSPKRLVVTSPPPEKHEWLEYFASQRGLGWLKDAETGDWNLIRV